ncbi:MAG: hypothetical protein JJU20_05960 [Opitutales bacterium]|nr:hypothetical protein [Opitutales bacterium]
MQLRWTRILLVFLIMSTGAWAIKSVAFYYFFKSIRQFDEVSLVDMLAFPLNRSSVREAQGDYQIRQAELAIDRGDYFRARNLLQQGVSRSPANLEGRMLLVQLFAGWRTELALQLLENGYEYGKEDAEFVRAYCTLLLRERQDNELIALTDRLLAEPDLPDQVRKVAAISRMQAAIQTGDYSLANQTYWDHTLYETPDGILLACDIMARLGQKEQAVALLEALIRQFPDHELDAIHQRLVSIYRDTGNLERARQRALDYAIRNPEKWQARILLLESLAETDPHGQFSREARAVVRAFSSNEAAMRRLGSLVTSKGDRELATRIYEIAVENFFDMGSFSLMLTEATIRAGEHAEAIRILNEWSEAEPAWLAAQQHLFSAMRAIAYFSMGNRDRGHFYLNSFRNSRRSTADQKIYVAEVLAAVDLKDAALTLLEAANRSSPNHERALSSIITMKIDLGEASGLAGQISDLLELRRPDYRIIQAIHDALSSDRFIYTPNRRELLSRLDIILSRPRTEELDLMPPLRQVTEEG